VRIIRKFLGLTGDYLFGKEVWRFGVKTDEGV